MRRDDRMVSISSWLVEPKVVSSDADDSVARSVIEQLWRGDRVGSQG
jgi:hypothetical protein